MGSNLELNRVITNGNVFMIVQSSNNDERYTTSFWYDNSGYLNISDYYGNPYIALFSTIEQLNVDRNRLHYLNGEKLVFPSLKIKEEVIFDYQNTKGEFHKYFIVKIDDKYNLYKIDYSGKVNSVLSSSTNVFEYENTEFTIV